MLSKRTASLSLLLAGAPALLSLSCLSRQSKPRSTQSAELVFSSRRHDFGRVFPGTYAGTVSLQNATTRAIKDVYINRSCACVVIKAPQQIDRMEPGQSIEIPFTFTVSALGPSKQVLTANIKGTSRDYYHPLRAVGIAPVADIENNEITLPAMPRRNSAETSQTVTLSKPISPEATGISIATHVAWLQIGTRAVGNTLVLEASADRFAPEGAFSVPARIEHLSEGKKMGMGITISGRIISKTTTSPALLTFGLIALGRKPRPQQCVVTVETPLAAPVTVACDDARVHAKVTRQQAGQITLQISIDPAKSGEIDSSVHLRENGKALTDIPVSAFVSP